jgi:hypothetical protein
MGYTATNSIMKTVVSQRLKLPRLPERLTSMKYFKSALFMLMFALLGTILLFTSRAATPYASLEPELGTRTANAAVVSDSTASGGSAVRFGGAAVTSDAMPTPDNTGPIPYPTQTMSAAQFISSRACENKRITDNVRLDTNNMSGQAGQTFTVNNCVFEQGFAWYESSSSYALSQYPTINMTNVEVKGTFNTFLSFRGTWDHVKATNGWNLVHSTDCAGSMCGPTRDIPLTVSNSYISANPIPGPEPCFHSEAFHAWGNGGNYTFINTRFVQLGVGTDPYAFCHTGAIYQEGGGGVTYNGCYFDDGSPTQQTTYFFTINIDGGGTYGSQNVVKNSYIEKGGAYATNPRAPNSLPATYTNNFDFNTGAPISIP